MTDGFSDTVIEQFPTTVMWRHHRNLKALNDALAALIRGLRQREPNTAPGSSTRGGYQTDTNFLYRTDPPVRVLQQLISQGMEAYLPKFFQSNLAAAPKNVESRLWGWAVIMRPGDYNVPHVHPDAHVSGVYYVEVPDLSAEETAEPDPGGSLVMYDPRSIAGMYHLKGRIHNHDYVPTAGALVIFPSFLLHAVNPYRSSGERICVAFNARLTLT